MAPLRYAAKFDPFRSLDCAPTPSILAQSKERKGSNFAIWQHWSVFVYLSEGHVDSSGADILLVLLLFPNGFQVERFQVAQDAPALRRRRRHRVLLRQLVSERGH